MLNQLRTRQGQSLRGSLSRAWPAKRGVSRNSGQSTLEYAVLLAIVLSALLAVQVYIKRAAMGRMRTVTDQQIGRQWDPFAVSGTITSKNETHRNDVLTTDGKTVSTLQGNEVSSQNAAEEKIGAVTVFELFPE